MATRTRPQRRGARAPKAREEGASPDRISRPESIQRAYETERNRAGERRRHTAEETALNQHCFRKALEESVALGLMAIGLSGRQVWVSDAFCDMVGRTHEQLVGCHPPFPYWPPDETRALTRYFESVMMEREHPPSFESRFLRKDGTTVDVRLMHSLLKDGRGRLSGWVFSVGNLTDRRKSENALLEYEKKLAALSSQLLSAHEEERRVIACEIHDTICSCLAAVGFGLQKLNQEDPDVKSLMEITAHAIKESRRIMTALRPSMLDDLGITETVNWLCREFQGVYSSIKIAIDISIPEGRIPDALKIVIFRILQEALNNIAKHSHADSVSLRLHGPQDRIELIIKDNGAGFDITRVCTEKKSERGVGLESMRHRAEISGGTFEIESGRGRGTTIRASWPLPQG